MTPYHHYPRVGLQYCRCVHCGNDLRSRTLSRLFDTRDAKRPNVIIPKYKLKRRHKFGVNIKLKSRVRKQPPPYKQRRELNVSMQLLVARFRPK